MRFESATVPAAVMPDPTLRGMMVFEIPATVPIYRDGKASKNRDKSEDLPEISNIQSFREEKRRINY